MILLDPNLPSLGEQPARDECVIACIEQITAPPVIMRKLIKECGVLQDRSPISGRASREALHPAIEVVSACDAPITPAEAARREPFPDRVMGVCGEACALEGSDAADLRAFEAGEDERHEFGRPEDVVVGEDYDGAGGARDAVGHLLAFTRVGDADDAEASRAAVGAMGQGGCNGSFDCAEVVSSGDDEDLVGLLG